MKKLVLFIAFALLTIANSFAQLNMTEIHKILSEKEDTLKIYADNIIDGINISERFKSDSLFTRHLVKALKVPYSFNYPFDSLFSISRLYSPDSSFRIFTWQLRIDDNIIRQHGAIQMKTSDGTLKLFPLIDKSDVTENYQDTIADNFGWMGAIYYKMVLKKADNKNVYTLLGFDENNIRSSKKILEVLTFENDKPVFGGHYFRIPNDSIYPHDAARYVMEFKKDAGPRLTYDDEMNIIVMEHLVSESNEPQKKWTLIGDGDYEGLTWTEGKWVYIPKVFKETTPEGQVPVPVPMKESKFDKKD